MRGLLVTLSTMACSGWVQVATMSFTLLRTPDRGSPCTFRTKCGLTLLRRRASDTAPLLMPNCLASNRGRPAGRRRGGDIAKCTSLSTVSGESAWSFLPAWPVRKAFDCGVEKAPRMRETASAVSETHRDFRPLGTPSSLRSTTRALEQACGLRRPRTMTCSARVCFAFSLISSPVRSCIRRAIIVFDLYHGDALGSDCASAGVEAAPHPLSATIGILVRERSSPLSRAGRQSNAPGATGGWRPPMRRASRPPSRSGHRSLKCSNARV